MKQRSHTHCNTENGATMEEQRLTKCTETRLNDKHIYVGQYALYQKHREFIEKARRFSMKIERDGRMCERSEKLAHSVERSSGN